MDDLDTAPRRDYIVKGVMAPNEISVWVGAPKCGKSFLLLSVAYRLPLGLSVFGRRVRQAKALYVAAEGEGDIANRIKALRVKHGPSDGFHWIAQPADLLHREGHLDDLKAAARACGAQIIVLDTLSRMMAGGDENSPADMGRFVANLTELRAETMAHIAVVHHGTKASNGSTPRGHSSLTGADDALIEIVKLGDGSRAATVIHAKDDADGDPITTLLVNEKTEASAVAAKSATLTNNEMISLKCLDEALKASGTTATVGENFEEQKVVTIEDWRTWFYRTGKPGDGAETKRKAFNRAKDALIGKDKVAADSEYVWRPKSL
jgi:hypothetical protein